jgi:hypothetical protein
MNGCPAIADIEQTLTLAPHHANRLLHQEERRTHVGREHAVEERWIGIEDRAAGGHRGRVDQHVDAPELRVGCRDHRPAIVDQRQIRLHEAHLGAAGRAQFARLRFAFFLRSSANDHAFRPALDEQPGNRGAESLRSAGHDGYLRIELSHESSPDTPHGHGTSVWN